MNGVRRRAQSSRSGKLREADRRNPLRPAPPRIGPKTYAREIQDELVISAKRSI
jgi:hypothetical protein